MELEARIDAGVQRPMRHLLDGRCEVAVVLFDDRVLQLADPVYLDSDDIAYLEQSPG